jgi:hypothetical protein
MCRDTSSNIAVALLLLLLGVRRPLLLIHLSGHVTRQ